MAQQLPEVVVEGEYPRSSMWPLVLSQGINTAANIWGNIDANNNAKDIAREQMAFQERMSNTPYQRATADMRKAGLNPLLAYGQGGSSTPSGSTYQPKNIMEGSSSSALDIVRLKKDIEEAETRIELNKESKNTQVIDQILKGQQVSASQQTQIAQELSNWAIQNRQNFEKQHPKTFAVFDALIKRLGDSLGAALDAKSLSNPLPTRR